MILQFFLTSKRIKNILKNAESNIFLGKTMTTCSIKCVIKIVLYFCAHSFKVTHHFVLLWKITDNGGIQRHNVTKTTCFIHHPRFENAYQEN